MAEPLRDMLVDERYRVINRLGTGGMADVFLAQDEQLGRKVALKLLHRRFAEDPDFVERFRREAQSAAGLQHPNVVSVYDRGTFDGTYYIAMEYLPGRSLKDLIRQEAPLDPLRAIDIAIQILKAARFAHREGVIHRDLKPHNVIVDDSGHAKVTDFGIARAGASDMTETGSIMGTAQYLSPEQAQGHSVSAGSDLYSVGVVLYEMLTGRVPFDAESAVTIALKHVSEAPVPPSAINPSVPPELDQTVMWVLNKNASDRPADADQLIGVLEHCRALIADPGYVPASQDTASMAAVAAAAAAAGNRPGGALAPPPVHQQPATNGAGRPPPAGGPENDEARRWLPWALGALVVALVVAAAAAAYFISRPKQYVVPKVTGQQFSIAQTEVRDAHFQAAQVTVPSPQAAGIVLGEDPSAGSKADKGSVVTLTVSRGPGNVSIPPVEGFTREGATKFLTKAGLKVTHILTENSSQFKSGQALGTDPAAGRSVASGSAVTLIVSSGAAAKAVPTVTEESQAAATTALTQAGFNVSPTTQVSSTVTAGNVISQSPVGGTSEIPGTKVAIVVATAPPTVSVPPVTGDPVSGAIGALSAAGFAYQRETKVVRQASEDGVVISQSPTAGTSAKKGATVTIVVGRYRAGNSTTTSTSTTSSTSTSSSPTTSTTSSASSTAPAAGTESTSTSAGPL